MAACELVVTWLGQFCTDLLVDLVLTALLLYPLLKRFGLGAEKRDPGLLST